jgi:DNA-directed RNA polymerase subunit N (RpoN/RPB10)
MLPPIRCFGCGNVTSDKYLYYTNEVRKLSGQKAENRFYMDGTQIPQTAEMAIMQKLGLKRACCRRQFLTQVVLMDKI